VLDRQHCGPVLEALSSSNLFLIPLDHEGGWYRFHPLDADTAARLVEELWQPVFRRGRITTLQRWF